MDVGLVCEVADLVDARGLDGAVPEAGVLVVSDTVDVSWAGGATSVGHSERVTLRKRTRCKDQRPEGPS